MKKLRGRFDRFCYNNRHKGIPNLMLYVALTSGIIYIFSLISQSYTLFNALCFNRELILQGQVWRLVTGIFTSVFNYGNPLLAIIGLYCYYSLGRALEYAWGTLRFNLFYISGIVIMDLFAMVLGGSNLVMDYILFSQMGHYLNLSLLIAYATAYPDTQFLFLFIIPVKAWIFGLVYLGLTILEVVQYSYPVMLFPHNLFPLVALANYFLFVGSDVKNIFPFFRRKPKAQKTVYMHIKPEKKERPAYTHKCVLCGKTDVSHPDMEFRYCSKCNGYFCYCQEHISNHTHIE